MTDPLPYVRGLHFAATILAAGIVYFRFLVAEPAFGAADTPPAPAADGLRRRWSWILRLSLSVAIVSMVVWLAVLAATIYDVPLGDIWRNGGIWTVLTETRFGQICCIRVILAALLALMSAMTQRAELRSPSGLLQFALASGFLLAPAWTGHAGATPGLAGDIPLAADVLHLLAAGVWLGGLLPLAMLLAAARDGTQPISPGVMCEAVGRFSLLGAAGVGALLISGVVNSWYEVGSIGNLTSSAYGRLVLAKIALFAAMVTVASINRFRLTPRLPTAAAARHLRRNTLVETTLGFSVVAIVGFLGAMEPAAHAHHHAAYGAVPADAAFTHIHSEKGMAEVTIEPGHVGSARATIRLWNDDFETLDARQVTLTLTAPGAASKPITRLAAPAPDGAWRVDSFVLSMPGNWTVAVRAALPNGPLTLAAPIVIEPAR